MSVWSKLSPVHVSFTTIHYVLAGVTLLGTGALFFKRRYEQGLLYTSPVFLDAVEKAKQHTELRTLLGDPITGGKVDPNNKNNYKNEFDAHIEVPLRGKKHNALMLIDAKKDENDNTWRLNELNILFHGKEEIIGRLNIFKRTEN